MVIGAGNMGGSLIGGFLANGIAAADILVVEHNSDNAERIQQRFGIHLTTIETAPFSEIDAILLAVKPQVTLQVTVNLASALGALIEQPLIISVAAGVTIDTLQQGLQQAQMPVVRCMPNTPALVGEGMTGLFANNFVSDPQRQLAEDLLAAVGSTVWVEEERLIDAVTAISGSGPAYYFYLMQAMIEAGVELGLSSEQAAEISFCRRGAERLKWRKQVQRMWRHYERK